MEIRPNALPNKIQIGAALRFRAPAMRCLHNLSITSPGSSTVKVESRPGPTLSAQIEPRCSSTSAFQIQAEATELASDFHAALLKKIQDTRERFRRNAHPVILYLQFPFSAHLPSGRYPDSTIPGGLSPLTVGNISGGTRDGLDRAVRGDYRAKNVLVLPNFSGGQV
jgi:hypothetical protein